MSTLRKRRRVSHLALPALAALLLASCSMTSDPDTLFGLAPTTAAEAVAEEAGAEAQGDASADEALALAEPALAVAPAASPAAASDPARPAATETTTAIASADATPTADEKRSFLSGLFGSGPAERPSPQAQRAERPLIPQPAAEPAKPLVALAAVNPTAAAEPARQRTYNDALPGVRPLDALFEIKRSDGLDTDEDIDVYEAGGTPYQIASLAPGLARLAPNGLRTKSTGVDVTCLQPSLVRTLKSLEAHFGKPVVVTSGYRSPEHNKRVRGARNSYHMRCAAADVQVVGVDKHRVANYLRALPGRGGVGTYCSHHSVHVDTGPRRDWNWRCRT